MTGRPLVEVVPLRAVALRPLVEVVLRAEGLPPLAEAVPLRAVALLPLVEVVSLQVEGLLPLVEAVVRAEGLVPFAEAVLPQVVEPLLVAVRVPGVVRLVVAVWGLGVVLRARVVAGRLCLGGRMGMVG